MLRIAKKLPINYTKLINSGISTTAVHKNGAKLAYFKKLQADFQCEDGKPIWLKRGITDRILSSSTMVLSVVGTLMTLIFLYDSAKPASWKTTTC